MQSSPDTSQLSTQELRRGSTFRERAGARMYATGEARVQAVDARIARIKALAIKTLGADEAFREAYDTINSKAENINGRFERRVHEIKDLAIARKDAAIAKFQARKAEAQQKARDQRDAIVTKAKDLGHRGVNAVTNTVNAAVDMVELGVGTVVGGAVAGSLAVERGVKWTIGEVQAVPKDLKAIAHTGLSGLGRSVADRALAFSTSHNGMADSHRVAAISVRTNFAQPGPVARMVGR